MLLAEGLVLPVVLEKEDPEQVMEVLEGVALVQLMDQLFNP
jgi:hypothetical protein